MNPSSTFHPKRRMRTAALLGAVVGVQSVAAAVAPFAGGFRATPSGAAEHADAELAAAPFYDLTRDAAQALWNGEQTSIARCMQRRGFDYTPALFAEVDEYRHAASAPRDLEALRREGYGVAGRFGDRTDPSGALDAEPDGEPWQFADALLGPDLPDDAQHPGPGWERAVLAQGATMYWYSDSCIARGFRDIYGALHPHDEIPLALERWRGAVSARLAADPAYQGATRDWGACMRQQGYELGAPSEARELLEEAASAPGQTLERLSALELAVAAADATCDGEVDLDARVREARRRAVLGTPAPDADWDSLASELATALERARQVVSAGNEPLAPRGVARLDAPLPPR